MVIRVGFKYPCMAGSADVTISGEMRREEVEDIIAMLQMTVRRLERRIEEEKKKESAQ